MINSEIVLPVMIGDSLIAVLDIDSPKIKRFSAHDKGKLAEIVKFLVTEIA